MATLNQPKRVSLSLWIKQDTYDWLRDTRRCESINSRAETILDEASTAGKPRSCACGCGRRFFGSAKRKTYDATCRKRLQRKMSQSSVTKPSDAND